MAEEVRQFPHVVRTTANPGRHEIEIWVRFPAEGLLRKINQTVKSWQCEVTGGEVR